jgi:Tol biopolymer transport system component
MRTRAAVVVITLIAAAGAPSARKGSTNRSSWTTPINLEAIPGTDMDLNTRDNEGCPAISRDGRRLFFASNRPGGFGGQDIWMSERAHADEPWGKPVNVGAPINTPADDFCPSPMPDGHGFLYVSAKPGGCGGADIYLTRESRAGGWPLSVNLGCHVNSAAGEASPFIVEYENGAELYFSSTRPGGFSSDDAQLPAGDSDIYVSLVLPDGSLAPPVLAPGLNTSANDARPNVRRDGLEVIFDSDRPGTLGMADLYSAVRAAPGHAWSEPANLGDEVNSTLNETRPSMSWDARTLFFGSTRSSSEGMSDLYATTRRRW